MTQPTQGRIVLYVLPEIEQAPHLKVMKPLQVRPAMVVNAFEKVIHLQQFTDGTHDRGGGGENLIHRSGVEYDETGTKPGTWHWPPRTEPTAK